MTGTARRWGRKAAKEPETVRQAWAAFLGPLVAILLMTAGVGLVFAFAAFAGASTLMPDVRMEFPSKFMVFLLPLPMWLVIGGAQLWRRLEGLADRGAE